MQNAAFQVHYPKETRHCYGCGTLNEHGLHIESFWDGEETVCRFKPRPYHTAIPGYVYGGLIASIIDCHSIGTAAANAYRAEGREMDTEPHLRFVTGSLQVDYLRPTPIGIELEVRGEATEIQERSLWQLESSPVKCSVPGVKSSLSKCHRTGLLTLVAEETR